MRINVHAGHNPQGMIACGAVGIVDESREDRIMKDKLIALLRNAGHTVYDCTCDNGKSVNDVLAKIVSKCNAHTVDLDVSIHLNAGGGQGVEVLVYDTSSYSPVSTAQKICEAISALGYKNRGVKKRPDLYVLRNTKAPALLVETLFCDSSHDVGIYDPDEMAAAMFKGITGAIPSIPTPQPEPEPQPAPQPANNSFVVRVTIPDLNIRKGPGTNYARVGYIPKGAWTIVEVQQGSGSSTGWGRLKSGVGWISLDFATRI